MENRSCISFRRSESNETVVSRWALSSLLAFAMLGLLFAGPARAGWKGSSLEWQYYAYGGAYNDGGSPGNCVVSKKSTFCGEFFEYFNIDADKSSITFDYSPSGTGSTWNESNLSLPPTIYNGIAINLTSSGTIKSVQINPATNMVGFDAHRVSFTAKQIQVDWQNLPFNASTLVKLDVKVVNKAGDVVPAFQVAKPAKTTRYPSSVHQPALGFNPPKN